LTPHLSIALQVVWERISRKTRLTERIPFLNMARSLGDYWSFSGRTQQYIISPEPDVNAFELLPNHFLLLATDGVLDMLTPEEALETVLEVRPWDHVSAVAHTGRGAGATGPWTSA
jgi:serine/threonine protein phosphatase PrpC